MEDLERMMKLKKLKKITFYKLTGHLLSLLSNYSISTRDLNALKKKIKSKKSEVEGMRKQDI